MGLSNNLGKLSNMITSTGSAVGIGTSSTNFNTAGLPLVVGSGSGNTGLTIFSGASSSGSIHFADAETTGAGSYAGYINYDHSGNSMQFATNSTERMRITSGGNVGIGTTSPSSWATNLVVYNNQLTITGGGYDGSFADSIFFGGNSEGTNYRNKISNSLSSNVVNQKMKFSIASGATTFADVMTLVGNGNVGIGTSSPTNSGGYATLTMGGATSVLGQITWNSGATAIGYLYNDATNMHIGSNAALVFQTTSGGGATERMRINSLGEVGIGTSAIGFSTTNRGNLNIEGSASSILALRVNSVNEAYYYSDGSNTYLYRVPGTGSLYAAAGTAGVYITNGATSWTANSDERLKNITGSIENAVESLMTLRTVKHTWKSDDTNKEHLALIAQDVEKVFPQVIDISKLPKLPTNPSKDETEYLGVRYTELIPVLVKAIQELNEKLIRNNIN